MKGRPRRTKKDANQPEIVARLRANGFVVFDCSDLGGDVLDLMVCYAGRCIPVEVKMPGCEKDLTEGEAKTIYALKRVGVVPCVATCAQDVHRAFNLDW